MDHDTTTRPYWDRQLRHGAVALHFDQDQASALANELRGALAELHAFYPRLDELAHRLTFDADYLREVDLKRAAALRAGGRR